MARVKMPRSDRAKQFMPFDALKGLQKALRMKEYQHERVEKGDLDEEKIAKITKNLTNLDKNSKISVNYYDDGHYKTIIGRAKILYEESVLMIDNKKINFDEIFDVGIVN